MRDLYFKLLLRHKIKLWLCGGDKKEKVIQTGELRKVELMVNYEIGSRGSRYFVWHVLWQNCNDIWPRCFTVKTRLMRDVRVRMKPKVVASTWHLVVFTTVNAGHAIARLCACFIFKKPIYWLWKNVYLEFLYEHKWNYWLKIKTLLPVRFLRWPNDKRVY